MPARTSVRARAVALILALALVAPGQANAGFLDYMKNRGLDLADIFGLRVSGAKKAQGAGVMVRATCLAQVGAVYFDGEHAGMDRRAIGVWRERRLQGALGPLAITRIETRTQKGNQFAYDKGPWAERELRGIERNGEFWDDGRRHPLAIGAEVQPGILPGIEVRFDPLELVDFIVGFTTIDIYDDDLPSKRGATESPEPEQADALGAPEPLEGAGEALPEPGIDAGFNPPPDTTREPAPAVTGDALPPPGIQPPTRPPSAATPVPTATPAAAATPIPATTPIVVSTAAPAAPAQSGATPTPLPATAPKVSATPSPVLTYPPGFPSGESPAAKPSATPKPAATPKAKTPRPKILKERPLGTDLPPILSPPSSKESTP